jgi:glycerol-3-phosphate dehydrogenase (NAD(P)+)
MSQVLAETMPAVSADRLVVLSGPSLRARSRAAPDGRGRRVAGDDGGARGPALLHSPIFRVYTSDDPIGVQVGGAVKNVIAVATGACEGLALGANARAALITRGLAEITRLGVALGANPLTFLGLAGVGDLVLTSTGDLSRNRTLGKKVAEGIDPRAYLASNRSVAEGFFTAAAAYELSRKLAVEMPITEQVFHVLHRGRPLSEAAQLLMTRQSKNELYGIG